MTPFNRVDELKTQLYQHRPLPAAAVKNLRGVYRVEWTYNSKAIDGTLSLIETKVVTEDGLTKRLQKHLKPSTMRDKKQRNRRRYDHISGNKSLDRDD